MSLKDTPSPATSSGTPESLNKVDGKEAPPPVAPAVVYAPDSNPEGRIGATEVMTTADLPSDTLVALAFRRHKLKEMFPVCKLVYSLLEL